MTAFLGYPGQVWQVCYTAINWFNQQLDNGAAPATSAASAGVATYYTLRNAIDAVDAQQTALALATESANMAQITALGLILSTQTQNYMNARIAGINNAASGVSALAPPVNPYTTTTLLSQGKPAIPDPMFLEYCMQFTGEAPPSSLTTADTLPTAASGMATAWLNVANTIYALQGGPVSTAYDTAARQYRISNMMSSGIINQLTATPFTINSITNSPLLLWNRMVAIQSILIDASTFMSSPFTIIAQQSGVIRYALYQTAFSIALFLLALRKPILTQVNTTTIHQNDTLQDIAARSTGNFENWTGILTLNGLLPPYPSPTDPDFIGREILLPSTGSPPASGAPVPSYSANVLGTDVDFGPINGSMPAWAGDFQTITGYQNLARALGRRLQTTLGALIFHQEYGSRIPPEVGAIQGTDEAARLASFGKQALTMDPRTGSVISATSTVQPGFLATFQGIVQPIGPGSSPVQVNETISPLP